MRMFVRQVVTAVGTYGSLVALVYAVKNPSAGFTGWEQVLIGVATLIFLSDIGLTIADFRRRRELRYKPGQASGRTDQRLHVQMDRAGWSNGNY